MTTHWRGTMKDGRDVVVTVTDHGCVRVPFDIRNPRRPTRVYRTVFEFDGQTVTSDVDLSLVSPLAKNGKRRVANVELRETKDLQHLQDHGLQSLGECIEDSMLCGSAA